MTSLSGKQFQRFDTLKAICLFAFSVFLSVCVMILFDVLLFSTPYLLCNLS